MAKYQASNRTFDIPEEGEIFIGKEDPRFVYKRVGEKVYHTWAKDVPLTNLPVRGIADFTGVLGAGKFENWQSPSFFTQGQIIPGQDLSAMEQVRRAQGLPVGAPIPGATVGANIVAQPGIAPQSTFSVVAQGIADVQRRIDEISGKPLSTASTASSPTPPYVPPAQVPTLSTAAITGSALGAGTSQLSPEQQKVQTDTEKLYDLITQKATKPAYEIEQKKALGVSSAQDLIDDLSTQLMDLDFQAKAIPMQIQEQFKGTGATTAGVAPIEAAALRNNAIQALGLSAQLAAAQGKLATAERRVKDAVDAKYAPIEADIDAKLANLQLAKNSPAYTLAEKKQAAELEAQITAQKNAVVQEKKDTEKKLNYADEYYANGGTNRKVFDQIANAGTPLEASALLMQSGYGVKKGAGVITPITPTPTPIPVSPYQEERQFRTLQSVDELKTKAMENPGIFGATAALPLPDFMRSSAYRNFKAELDTLKSSITFGELTAMREASKTGGALGQVSDVENRLLSASLGALDMSQSPTNFVAQLEKIKASINRWKNAVQGNTTNVVQPEDLRTKYNY